jgi:16S rRNA (uracil1498-N3)-methyltransferase
MNIHRFFIPMNFGDLAPKDSSKSVTLPPSESLVNQLKNVFRFEPGDKVIFFDNSGYDYLVKIDSLGKENVSVTILETIKNNVTLGRDVYLFASIVKKDNFEWIVQKATELGVTHIVPVLGERSEKKNLNFERLNKIIVEASEQSGRGVLSIVCNIMTLEDAIYSHQHIKSVAWNIEAPKFVSRNLESVSGIYIGPEGGWSEKEIELFNKNEIPVYSLGPQVLRAETAVIAALSQIVF